MYPALIRAPPLPKYIRERINTPDEDFLDLDWIKNSNTHLVILSHGLEGNSTRQYMAGMANIFSKNGFDILAWNYRGCSDEQNCHLYSYHSGFTQDLELVIKHAVSEGYRRISLVGFSLGGNMTLKYLGEGSTEKFKQIESAVVFSVPIDLRSCAVQIHKKSNFLYELKFLRSFKQKLFEKAKLFPELDTSFWKNVNSVFDFDEFFTAPQNGFKSALDYYEKCSAIKFISGIEVPTLVVTALNDPFLGNECLDPTEFKKSRHVYFERPDEGGHVGFAQFGHEGVYWSEKRALVWVSRHK
ncbi:MAG: alpha/beta fold hydrolase [Cyclobacteriaceae bacterium]